VTQSHVLTEDYADGASHGCAGAQLLFQELSNMIVQLDNDPKHNLSTMGSQEAFDLWKAHETKAIHELMKAIDKNAYEVRPNTPVRIGQAHNAAHHATPFPSVRLTGHQAFMNQNKSKMLITGNMRVRIRVMEARNLMGTAADRHAGLAGSASG